MSVTRNNHYVPQWYHEGFFEPGRSSLAHVDMTPDRRILPDGGEIVQRGEWTTTCLAIDLRRRKTICKYVRARATSFLRPYTNAEATDRESDVYKLKTR